MPEDTRYRCEECDCNFESESEMQEHERQHHGGHKRHEGGPRGQEAPRRGSAQRQDQGERRRGRGQGGTTPRTPKADEGAELEDESRQRRAA